MYIVYSKPNCTYCDQAKALLKMKNLDFSERILDVGQAKLPDKEYVSVEYLKSIVPTVKTVPQIFNDDNLIGGFDALKLLLAA
jgi:glutaredoxin 3